MFINYFLSFELLSEKIYTHIYTCVAKNKVFFYFPLPDRPIKMGPTQKNLFKIWIFFFFFLHLNGILSYFCLVSIFLCDSIETSKFTTYLKQLELSEDLTIAPL